MALVSIWWLIGSELFRHDLRVGATVLMGAIGEIEKVGQAFQPADHCFILIPCSFL
jgi:hypothetical protein